MELHQAGHISALNLQCESSERQVDYLERLRQLSSVESLDFMGVYEGLSASKSVTSGIRVLLEGDILSGKVSALAGELVAVLEALSNARIQQDLQLFHQLHGVLDDLNIAVNAWQNRVCLKHCGLLYRRYRCLLHHAHHSTLN